MGDVLNLADQRRVSETLAAIAAAKRVAGKDWFTAKTTTTFFDSFDGDVVELEVEVAEAVAPSKRAAA